MLSRLPYGSYNWMTGDELLTYDPIADASEDAEWGCILEVDLLYPEELHVSHNRLNKFDYNLSRTIS